MTAQASRRRLSPDKRREEIVRRAADVFRDRSYEDVSTTELARAAGVSRGLLNHYFRTKRDLYLAVVQRLMEAPLVPVPGFVEGATVEDRVHDSVQEWVHLVEREAASWLVATRVGFAGGDDQVQALVDRGVDRVVDRICELTGLSGLARERDQVRAALRGYAGFATAICREWLEQHRLTRDESAVLLEGVLLKLVRDLVPEVAGQPSEVGH